MKQAYRVELGANEGASVRGPVGLGDDVLLERARGGDRTAFGELWTRYHRLAISVASPLAYSETEDIVSDSFSAIWTQLQSGRGPREHFRAYLLATVRNLAARSHKRATRVLTGVEMDEEEVEDETGAIEHEEDVRHVAQAFKELPDRYQQVLWLAEVEELNRGQIAERMELTPNTATQLLRRAKEGLRVAWLTERTADAADHPHAWVIEGLPRYVRGTLPRTKKQRIRDHLAACPECSGRAKQLQQDNLMFAGALALIPLVGAVVALPGGATGASALAGGAFTALRQRVADALLALPAKPVLAVLVIAAVLAGAYLIQDGPRVTTASEPTTAAEKPAATEAAPKPSPTAVKPAAEDDAERADRDTEDPAAEVPPVVPETPTPQTPEPTPLPETAPTVPALSMQLWSAADGVFAPVVGGEGAPGVPVAVEVSGATLTAVPDAAGAWSVDLAQLSLYAGMHSARARQAGTGGEQVTTAVNFDLRLPAATAQSEASGASTQLDLTGIPGATVCVLSGATGSPAVTLGQGGAASLGLAGVGAGAVIEFAYCGDGRVGAVGAVRVP